MTRMYEKPRTGLALTPAEIKEAFSGSRWEEIYPPILTAAQAAQLAQLPLSTIYQMSSRGQLKNCAKKTGKHLRFHRDRLIAVLFN